MFKGMISKKKKQMIKVKIMAGGHRGKLQKTLIDFGKIKLKLRKCPSLKNMKK